MDPNRRPDYLGYTMEIRRETPDGWMCWKETYYCPATFSWQSRRRWWRAVIRERVKVLPRGRRSVKRLGAFCVRVTIRPLFMHRFMKRWFS